MAFPSPFALLSPRLAITLPPPVIPLLSPCHRAGQVEGACASSAPQLHVQEDVSQANKVSGQCPTTSHCALPSALSHLIFPSALRQSERRSKKQSAGGTREAVVGSPPQQPVAGKGAQHCRRSGGGGSRRTGARPKAGARCDRYAAPAGAGLFLSLPTPSLLSLPYKPAILPRIPCADARDTLASSTSIRFSAI
jgi:hypothetical protein